MKPTVKDIAAAAGVSPGTVSNALNGRKGVSETVRETVFRIATEFGYLKEEQEPASNVIRIVMFKRHGHVVSDTPFFSSLVEGMEREARHAMKELRITHLNLQEPDYRDVLAMLAREPSAGLIVLATEMIEEDLALFSGVRAPMVIVDNRFHDNPCDAVLIDNADGAWKAVSFLASLGHTRIGYLHSAFPIRNFTERGRGYADALADRGLVEIAEDRILLDPTLDGAYRDMLKELMTLEQLKEQEPLRPGAPKDSRRVLPTAFFADNDIIAAGAIRALQEKGFRVPDDVSVIGFDDMPFCEVMTPRLSTVHVYKQEIGALAVKRLLVRMEEDEPVRLVTEMETALVVRESQKKLP